MTKYLEWKNGLMVGYHDDYFPDNHTKKLYTFTNGLLTNISDAPLNAISNINSLTFTNGFLTMSSGSQIITDLITWTEIRPYGNIDLNWDQCCSSLNGKYLVATTYGEITDPIGNGLIYTSGDYGNSWNSHSPQGSRPNRWGIADSNEDGSFIIVTGKYYTVDDLTLGGTFRSIDYGNSWSKVIIPYYGYSPISPTQCACCDNSGNIVYSFGYDGYMHKSIDKGTNWNYLFGLPHTYDVYGNTRIHTNHDGTIICFLSISSQKAYISKNSGSTWTLLNFGNPSTNLIADLNMNGDGNKLLAVGRNRSVYRSFDTGNTWTSLTIPQPIIHISNFIDCYSGKHGTIYAVGGEVGSVKEENISTTGGDVWWNSPFGFDSLAMSDDSTPKYTKLIAGQRPGRLYLGTFNL